ncbi:hypothetical protein ACQPZJ_18070 [Actinoplanes sp. CA-054009]
MLTATAVVAAGALALWIGHFKGPPPAPAASPTTSAGPPATWPSLPGVRTTRVIEAFATRWKAKPSVVIENSGRIRNAHLAAPYPGDSEARLDLRVISAAGAPEHVLGIACSRYNGRPAPAGTPAELADYCLRGSVGKSTLRDVEAWAEGAVLHYDARRERNTASHQFAGFEAVIEQRSTWVTLLLNV